MLRTLEKEFMEKRAADPQIVNPLQVLMRLQRLREDVPRVQEELSSLLAEKRDFVQSCESTLLPTAELLADLCARSGLQLNADQSPKSDFVETANEWKASVGLTGQ